jgi:hypothetical protein
LSCFLFWLRGLRRRIRIGFLIFFITSYQNLYKTMNVHRDIIMPFSRMISSDISRYIAM